MDEDKLKVIRKHQVWNRAKVLIKLVSKHGKLCWYCGHRFSTFKEMEIDHIVPKCRGGSSKIVNLALACKTCNRAKWTLTLNEFLHWLKKPKVSIPLLVERANVSEQQFSHYGEEIEKGLRKIS